MDDTCAVVGCDRQKTKHSVEDDGLTPLNFFCFESMPDRTLKERMRVCRRNDITLNNCKNMIICSRHFLPSEITGNRLSKPQLKDDAIPTINIPSEVPVIADCCVETPAATYPLKKLIQCDDTDEDEVSDDGSVSRHIHPITSINEVLPHWYCKPTDEFALYFEVIASKDSVPKVTKSVKVFADGSPPQFIVGSANISENVAANIVKNLDINIENDFILLLEKFSKLSTKVDLLGSAVRILQTVANEDLGGVQHVEDPDMIACDGQDDKLFLRFVMEQLELHSLQPHERKWSSDLIRWATVMRCHSLTTYRSLYKSGYLILPSERTLAKYTVSNASQTTCNDDMDDMERSVLRGLLEKDKP